MLYMFIVPYALHLLLINAAVAIIFDTVILVIFAPIDSCTSNRSSSAESSF